MDSLQFCKHLAGNLGAFGLFDVLAFRPAQYEFETLLRIPLLYFLWVSDIAGFAFFTVLRLPAFVCGG